MCIHHQTHFHHHKSCLSIVSNIHFHGFLGSIYLWRSQPRHLSWFMNMVDYHFYFYIISPKLISVGLCVCKLSVVSMVISALLSSCTKIFLVSKVFNGVVPKGSIQCLYFTDSLVLVWCPELIRFSTYIKPSQSWMIVSVIGSQLDIVVKQEGIKIFPKGLPWSFTNSLFHEWYFKVRDIFYTSQATIQALQVLNIWIFWQLIPIQS